MCRCAERRAALMRGGKALASADVEALRREAGFVVSSAVEDAGAALRRARGAAVSRLVRR